jgi:hypothetical protein
MRLYNLRTTSTQDDLNVIRWDVRGIASTHDDVLGI